MYKNLYVSADSKVKKINFVLRNNVSQRITRNGSGAGCTKVLAVALADGDRIHHDGCSG